MTCDTWHMTRDTWHVTPDTWPVTLGGGVKILSTFQLHSSFGLGGKVILRSWGKGLLNESINELVMKLFFRTAPARPGLLINFMCCHDATTIPAVCTSATDLTLNATPIWPQKELSSPSRSWDTFPIVDNMQWLRWRLFWWWLCWLLVAVDGCCSGRHCDGGVAVHGGGI